MHGVRVRGAVPCRVVGPVVNGLAVDAWAVALLGVGISRAMRKERPEAIIGWAVLFTVCALVAPVFGLWLHGVEVPLLHRALADVWMWGQ